MAPSSQRKSPRLVEKDNKEKNVKTSEVDKLKEKLKKAQEELRETKKTSKAIQKSQEKIISDLEEQLITALRKAIDAQSDTLHYMKTLTEKLEGTMRDNLELTKKVSVLSDDVEEFKKLSDNNESKKIIEKERKKSASFRKKMLKAQKLLRERQEKAEKEVKPWKLCEICGQEYDHAVEKSPRVLECGHTMCYSCIDQISESEKVKCPFDRKTTFFPSQGLEGLPKNFALLHM